jgi:transposase-like protein
MEEYPRTIIEFEQEFATEDACRKYLFRIRWPKGFRCPRCQGEKAWLTARELYHCTHCGFQTTVTAGTIFQDTRKPLLLWFRAMWYVTNQKQGVSALGLQRALGLGSYITAWTWLHKLRYAMVRPGRDRLSGTIEVDETFIGGEKPGKRGRGAASKVLVVVAVQADGSEIGRIRLQRVPDASANSLEEAIIKAVKPGSVVLTDGWNGYKRLNTIGYVHEIVCKEAEVGVIC